jgi:hypothetical protein
MLGAIPPLPQNVFIAWCSVKSTETNLPFTLHLYMYMSRDSSVGIALSYWLDDRVLGFDSRWGLGIFLFTTLSRAALGSTQPPIQWVPGALSLEVKRPGREADHSPPSSAEVKNAWILRLPQYVFMAWCLVKHRDEFNFFHTCTKLPLTLMENIVWMYLRTWP